MLNRRGLAIIGFSVLPFFAFRYLAKFIRIQQRIPDWLPILLVGLFFFTLGSLKAFGYRRGLVGGGGKAFPIRVIAGSCPTWSKTVNAFVRRGILAIGILSLSLAMWIILHPKP